MHATPPARTAAADSPSRLALLIGAWALVWFTLVEAASLAAPPDDIEQLTWVRSLQWGYYKHPPLPTFLLWPFVRLFGLHEWVAAALGAACTLTAIVAAWALVRRLAGARIAWLACLGTLCVTYYNGRLHYYNHNIVLLLAFVAAAWACWRAFAQRSLAAWALFGLAFGLGALAKYQIAVAAVPAASLWIAVRGWRERVHRLGPLLAALVALAVFAPHARWLVEHDFPPLHYALRSSLGAHLGALGGSENSLAWFADQLNRLSPALLLGALLLRRRRAAPADVPAPDLAPGAQRFLFAWGALPLLAIGSLGAFAGVDLQTQWGTAFMPFTCAWLVVASGARRWQAVRPSAVLSGFAAMQALLLAINWATSPFGPALTMKEHSRNFPAQQVADALAEQTRRELGAAPCVLAGPAQLASTLALRMSPPPLVLLDGRGDESPWVTPQADRGCPVVWLGKGPPPTAGADFAAVHALPSKCWWALRAAPEAGRARPASVARLRPPPRG